MKAGRRPKGGISSRGREYAEAKGLSLNQVRGLTDSDVEGLEIIEDNTDAVLRELDADIGRALEKIGLVAEGYAKRLCPVDTGRLRNSITHAIDADGKAAVIGTNVEYGPAVELGTSRQKEQPFLRPAAQDHMDVYRRLLKSELES